MLYDIVEHQMINFTIPLVALLQCIAVGWQWEAEQTMLRSAGHKRSMRVLGVIYWLPLILVSLVFGLGVPEYKVFAFIPMLFFSLVGMVASYKSSGLTFSSWYHEIVLCGVDKLIMSLNPKNKDQHKTKTIFVVLFESYFGLLIKFVNPALISLLLAVNLGKDMKAPYQDYPQELQLFGGAFVFVTTLFIIVPMFICDEPEGEFFDDIIKEEFKNDDIYEENLKDGDQVVDGPVNYPKREDGLMQPNTELAAVNRSLDRAN